MARVNKDGTISGRAGNVVYFTRGGVTYMKEYKKPHDPKRPMQLIQRAKVSAASAFLAGFRKILDTGYQGSETHKTGYMEALNYTVKNAMQDVTPEGSVKPVFEVAPEKLVVARGLITAPQIDVCQRIGDEINLNWDPKISGLINRHYDSLVLVMWQPGESAYADFVVGRRDQGAGRAKVDSKFDGPVHLWAFYVNQQKNQIKSKENVSDSVYLGEF